MVIKVKNNGEWVKIPYLSSDNNPIIPEAPLDGKQYARQSGEWTVVNIPVDKVSGKVLSTNDYTTAEKK